MRVLLVAIVLALLAPLPAAAGRSHVKGRVVRPTVAQAADAVLAAWRTDPSAGLARVRSRSAPNHWRVADELCARGEHEAAEALAANAPGPEVEALRRYLRAARERGPNEAARRQCRAVANARAREDRTEVLRLAADPPPDLTRVVGIDVASMRAAVLRDRGNLAAAAEIYGEVAQAAEAVGWLACAAHMHHQSGSCAWRRADYATAIDRWTRRVAVDRARELPLEVAGALGNLGNVYGTIGKFEEALAHQKQALAIVTELGDPQGQAQMLLNMGQLHRALGAYDEAHRCFAKTLELHERLDDPTQLATALANRGYLLSDLGRFREALEDQERALEILAAVGHRDGVARTFGNIGNMLYSLGRYTEAAAYLEASLRLLERGGDRAAVARMLALLGIVHHARGDYEEALAFQTRALRLQDGLDDLEGRSMALRTIGRIHTARGAFPEALAALEQALTLMEELGTKAGVAATISGIASVHSARGDFSRALALFERARRMREELGDRAGVADTLSSLATVHVSLGDYAEALGLHERSLEIRRAIGNPAGLARALANLGLAYRALGDHEKSLRYQEQALAGMETAGDRPDIARSLGNIGATWLELGDPGRARAYLDLALAASEALGDRLGVATVLANLSKVQRRTADPDGARRSLERGLALLEAMGERAAAAALRWDLGGLLLESGETKAGRRLLDQALRDARRLRATPLLVRFLPQMARHRLEAGEAGRALLTAQQALAAVETLLGGLGEEEGARARAEHVDVFDVGAAAAARLDEPGSMLEFLESGRAGALLESLGGRRPLRWTDVPEALHRAETQARADEARARRAHARALAGGHLPAMRRTVKALDEALEQRRSVSARFQREAKKQAGLLYPRAATLEEVQDWLEADEALVLYSLCLGEALALVLTRDEARIVSLGDAPPVEAACRALRPDDPKSHPDDTLARLRSLLVEPLALPDAATTVLVSPEGPLCYLPFAALFEDRAVALTPSGTTLALLREEPEIPGTKVLALGDPDYDLDPDRAAGEIYRRVSQLVSLPGTRVEAEAIGDVVLLGADANEAMFEKTLPQETRWRAVHLACHGLVDAERPTLSSLALTRTGDRDGYLTALEVLRLKIPANLAVLSACETAKGEVVKGEGILGLTRAFMYAGSPRVLCSLWKVDDEATRALMTRFYALWNPADGDGLSAAEALRRAQAFVRGHEAWAHPHYWAAWVLWGLP